MSEISYETINSLGEFGIISGDEKDLIYNVYDSSGNLLDLSRFSLQWVMSYYDQQDYMVSTITPSVTGVGEITVELDLYTTTYAMSGLPYSGKYSYQLILTNYDGEVFRYQGIMYVIPHPNT